MSELNNLHKVEAVAQKRDGDRPRAPGDVVTQQSAHLSQDVGRAGEFTEGGRVSQGRGIQGHKLKGTVGQDSSGKQDYAESSAL